MKSAEQKPLNIESLPSQHQSLLLHSEDPISQPTNSPTQRSYKTTSLKSSRSRWSSMPWKYEILSWIASLCFFIATVVVLKVVDGHPLPKLQFNITPNAIVGLLATFTEFFLIVPVNSAVGQIKWLQALNKKPMDNFRTIDEASRGPWGSLLLLAQRKGGLIGSFGALITIVALGIGTFFQQALRYDTIYPYSDDAWVPIAQYMNGSGFAQGVTGQQGSGVDLELLNAPYVALFSPPRTNFTVNSHCGTGNCTWGSYQTLGICNTCQNLTSELKITKVHFTSHDEQYATDHYTLPNGFGLLGLKPFDHDNYFSAFNALLNITTTLSPVHPPVLCQDICNASEPNWESVAFARNGSRLFSVFAVGASPGTIPAQPDANYTSMNGSLFGPPVAFECLLQFCSKKMRADFVNGTLFETEISRWTDQSLPPLLPSGHPLSFQPPDSPIGFHVTAEGMDGTKQWLSEFLVGNATVIPSQGEWHLTDPAYTSTVIQAIYRAMNTSKTGFPDLMDNLANTLTANLRSIPYQPPPIRGKAFEPVSHAVVNWVWLVLPLFELAGSLVFLVVVMMKTKEKGLTPWNNNVLAYFFHGLDGRPMDRPVRDTQSAMTDEARGLLLEFRPREKGGQLVISDQL